MRFVLASLTALALVNPAAAAETILNDASYLRAFFAFRTPVVIAKDGQLQTALVPLLPHEKKKGVEPQPVEDFQSPLPPADWFEPDFDDSTWARRHAPLEVPPGAATGSRLTAMHTATPSSVIFLRTRFVVDDPAQVGQLKLSLEYVGGVAVYINGQELVRGHLPAGELRPDTLAEKYPDDLYCTSDGAFLQEIEKDPAGFARRYRRLADVDVPAPLVRQGTNVLGLRIHRSPINEPAVSAKRVGRGGMRVIVGIWSYAGLRSLNLTAEPQSSVRPNTARPEGVQVWNCQPFETIRTVDYGDPGEPLRGVTLPAARNGVFSRRLVVSSDQIIQGLKVTVSDLVHEGTRVKIPATAVRVRCALPAVGEKSWAPWYRFDGLVEPVPSEISVVQVDPRHVRRDEPKPNCGALAPLWFSVRVPADAAAGRYVGEVTVAADGRQPTAVPLHVTVYGWTLPDPEALTVRNFGISALENLARHYGVPLWSDRHFELIGKSLQLMAEVNSRQVVVNLARHFYGIGGNSQSLVRWVRRPDGSYDHNFTIFDKLLETVERSIGKPTLLRLNCWGEKREGRTFDWATTVSLLDPASGKIEPLPQPPLGTQENYEFWKPVLDEVRKRVTARGWWDVTAMGHTSYCYPPASDVVSVYKKLWTDGVWSYSAHNGTLGHQFITADKSIRMPVAFAGCVWTEGRLTARGYSALLQPRPNTWYSLARTRHRDYSPILVFRRLPEEMIMRGHDGVGDFGVDVFPLPDPNRPGRYYHLDVTRCAVGPDCSTKSLLSPGANGAIATERFEMFREGMQLAETILYLQRALENKTISGELAQRVDRYLQERSEMFLRQWSQRTRAPAAAVDYESGRFERDEQLLALAAEVAAAEDG